jgi:hypothetical protein
MTGKYWVISRVLKPAIMYEKEQNTSQKPLFSTFPARTGQFRQCVLAACYSPKPSVLSR